MRCNVVCQSRNWEVFDVDLQGWDLPRDPLQNKSAGSGQTRWPPPRPRRTQRWIRTYLQQQSQIYTTVHRHAHTCEDPLIIGKHESVKIFSLVRYDQSGILGWIIQTEVFVKWCQRKQPGEWVAPTSTIAAGYSGYTLSLLLHKTCWGYFKWWNFILNTMLAVLQPCHIIHPILFCWPVHSPVYLLYIFTPCDIFVLSMYSWVPCNSILLCTKLVCFFSLNYFYWHFDKTVSYFTHNPIQWPGI